MSRSDMPHAELIDGTAGLLKMPLGSLEVSLSGRRILLGIGEGRRRAGLFACQQHHADAAETILNNDQRQRADGHQRPMAAGPFAHAVDKRRPAGQRRLAGQKTLQIVGQRLGRRVALVARLGHRAEHDRFQIDRHGRIDLSRRDRLFVHDLPQQSLAVVAGVRVRLRQQFVQRDAERIDVVRASTSAAPLACSGLM